MALEAQKAQGSQATIIPQIHISWGTCSSMLLTLLLFHRTLELLLYYQKIPLYSLTYSLNFPFHLECVTQLRSIITLPSMEMVPSSLDDALHLCIHSILILTSTGYISSF